LKRFRFPLERVLSYRQLECDREKGKLESLVQRREAEAREEENWIAQRSAAEHSVQAAGERVSGPELEALDGFRQYVSWRRQELQRRRLATERDIAAQREALVEARRKARLLEELKGRRRGEWQREADRELELFAGEIYLAKWKR
jgi:flagellar export protein FliJ